MLLGLLLLYLSAFHHVPVYQIFFFYIGVTIFLYLPGTYILELLDWKDTSASQTVLSILAGMAFTPIVYYMAGLIGQQWLFVAIMVCISIFSAYRLMSAWNSKLSVKLPQSWWKIVIVFCLLIVMLGLSHFSDLIIMKSGGYKLRINDYTESIFHLGIMNVVEHTIPPFYPYASGQTLSDYHVDMHILGAIFTKYFFIDPAIMAYYFLPTLLICMIAALPAIFFYTLHGSLNLSLFLGVLVFSADFSFIPGILLHMQKDFPWTIIFCPTIWSLFTLNGIMAAIPFFFGGALALQKYHSNFNVKHLLLFLIFSFAAYRVKSSMGLQMLGVALLTVPMVDWRQHKNRWLKSGVLIAGVLSIIFIDIFIKSISSDDTWVVIWKPLSGVIHTTQLLRVDSWVFSEPNFIIKSLKVIGALAVFFVGFMGTRLIFLKYLYDMVRYKKQELINCFLLLFIISGITLSEIIFLGGKYDNINNAEWFKVQSIIAATYFIPVFINSRKNRFQKYLLIILIILLSFPATINFIKLRNTPLYADISSRQLEAACFIKEELPNDSIFMEVPNPAHPSISSNFAGRTTVISFFRSFFTAKLKPEEILCREDDIRKFFGKNTNEARFAILKKYNVQYLVLPIVYDRYLSQCGWAMKIFGNNELSIYKIGSYTNYLFPSR